MGYLSNYLNRIRKRGNLQLAESIMLTASEISSNYLESFSFSDHEIGLLFGNVQSGKTGQMFGVICKATDLGFPVFIILTTNNITLQQQTLERVKNDLSEFCVCDEYDSEIFTRNNLMVPVIIVLKKEYNVLKQWSNILGSTGFMKGNPLFIIDDEADASSLNTLVNQNKQSSINRYLEEIKGRSVSSIYLQVTGTPQALLLQSTASGWHPYFTYYFRPGEGYLGGEFFFPKEYKPDCIAYIDHLKSPLKSALIHHLMTSAQILESGGKVCNFLIHPSVRKAVHNSYEREVQKEIDKLKTELLQDKLKSTLLIEYNSLQPEKSDMLDFEIIYNKVKDFLCNDKVNILVMNANSSITSEQYATGCNIIIGGNTLGRGVTFAGLQTIYYTRTAKKPQADTMWQHSRMFGYDRDPTMMKVYIDQHLYKLFLDINSTNNSIIAQVEKGIETIKIYYPEGLNPTRNNVLDKKRVSIISGGTNYFPFSPENLTIEQIDKLLGVFEDQESYYQVNLRLIKEVLSHIISDRDFKIESFVSIIDTLLAEKPTNQGILIVRRNRNVAKGTGALLSPNDWKLGDSFKDKVVLTIYKMTGEKGWNGRKIWVPNIKLPSEIVFYDVKDD